MTLMMPTCILHSRSIDNSYDDDDDDSNIDTNESFTSNPNDDDDNSHTAILTEDDDRTTDQDATEVSPSMDDDTLLPDELLDDEVPADSLQAVIKRSIPSQRDSSAKNDINPEVSIANIIPTNPDNRPSTQRYSMRSMVTPHFAKGFNMAIACTQMTAKEGLKRFGKDAEEALMREWKQLDLLEVYYGVFAASLTAQERSRALRLVQLIKLKKNGILRGRTCADGRKQRSYILAEDATSPTVSNEALLLTCVTDAKEGRRVVTADVPGAFLHADIGDDVVHVIVEGEQLKILLKSNPSYSRYVHKDPRTGKDRLYLRLEESIVRHTESRATVLRRSNQTSKEIWFRSKSI
jgi:hypothetical protein